MILWFVSVVMLLLHRDKGIRCGIILSPLPEGPAKICRGEYCRESIWENSVTYFLYCNDHGDMQAQVNITTTHIEVQQVMRRCVINMIKAQARTGWELEQKSQYYTDSDELLHKLSICMPPKNQLGLRVLKIELPLTLLNIPRFGRYQRNSPIFKFRGFWNSQGFSTVTPQAAQRTFYAYVNIPVSVLSLTLANSTGANIGIKNRTPTSGLTNPTDLEPEA